MLFRKNEVEVDCILLKLVVLWQCEVSEVLPLQDWRLI